MGARCDEVAYNTLATLVNNKESKAGPPLWHPYTTTAFPL